MNRLTRVYSPYLLIIAIALLLRLLWAVVVPVNPVSDSLAYDTFAKNLANGLGYGWDRHTPTAFWPVGTSFIYSLFYRAFGHNYLPIIVFNLSLAAVIIGAAMLLAETWFNRRIAIITGLVLGLWPSQIQFTTVLASELPFTALVLVALVVWLNERINLWRRVLVVGPLLAAASYVRPTALLIPILLMFFRWVSTREIFKTSTAIVIMFVLMALLIAPWSIRNTQVFGQFVTISTNGGTNLWMGNNPNSTNGFMEPPPETNTMNEAQRDVYLKSIAKAYIKEKPFLFAYNCLARLFDTHSRETIGVLWNEPGLVARYGKRILSALKIINQIYWVPVLGLALIGIVLLGQKYGWLKMMTHPAVVMWGYFASINAVIVAQDRYHFPSIPMIGILAAIPLVYWQDSKRKVQQPIKVRETVTK